MTNRIHQRPLELGLPLTNSQAMTGTNQNNTAMQTIHPPNPKLVKALEAAGGTMLSISAAAQEVHSRRLLKLLSSSGDLAAVRSRQHPITVPIQIRRG